VANRSTGHHAAGYHYRRFVIVRSMSISPLQCNALRLMEPVYTAEQCAAYLSRLLRELRWHADHFVVDGRRFEIPRLQAWHADNGIQYSYSNNLLQSRPWIEPLLEIRRHVEQRVGHAFNSVLVTYYRDGDDHVTWHADDERELGDQPVIASLSLGATRRFEFRNKSDGTGGGMPLRAGDLLLMAPEFQSHWDHRVPREPAIQEPRINLTFRQVVCTAADLERPERESAGQ
jgi:alkylated DNA repair dioxygenase AlkB